MQVRGLMPCLSRQMLHLQALCEFWFSYQLLQLPACRMGKWQRMAQNLLGSCTYKGDLDEAPGSCLQMASTLAVPTFWKLNQQM